MARSGFYNPDGYNPYDDVLEGKRSDGEADWNDKPVKKSSDTSDDVAESRNTLRDAENSALSGGFYQSSGNTADDKKSGKGKLSGFGNKKGLTVVGLILILVVGFGVFLGSSHSLLGPALSAKSLEQLDSMNAAQEIEMANTLACLSSGECEGELSEDVIKALEANGVEVGDDHKSLYYNGENISGDRLPEIMNENVAVRSAVNGATLGQIANTLDETAINIDNNRGISKNMFVDYEMSGNIEEDLKNYEDIVNDKIGGQISTNTYTEHEDVQYKTKNIDKNGDGKISDGEWCYVDRWGNCTDDSDEYVMKSHSTSSNSSMNAQNTYSTKDEATNEANSYIEHISSNVTQISSWGCTSLRLGQLLSAQQAANEKQQSIQSYSTIMEPISKMMSGDGTYSPYHALMTKLIEEKTINIADYANASIQGSSAEDTTVEVGKTPMTGSAITAPSVQALLTDTAFPVNEVANFSYERTNNLVNKSLSPHGFTVEQCNADQHNDEDYDGNGKRLHSNRGNLVAELITRATSIALNTSRGSGKTQSTGGLAWTGTRKFVDNILGKFVKKFFVNVNISNYIQFMGPAFGEASYANAGIVYEGVELGENGIIRGGAAYFSDMGAMGSGQTGADAEVVAEYNKATKTVLAKQAEVDRYNRSPFDVTSPNTFFGSIAYSFLPLTTNKNVTGLSSLIRNTGSSLSSLMGVASAATETTYYSASGDCDRFTLNRYNGATIKMEGDPFCNRKTVTDPSVLGKPHSDPEYVDFVSQNVENGEVKEDGELAQFMSYCAFRLSPPGILDAEISDEVEGKKTPLRRFAQFLTSIFGFLGANYDDEESGWVDYYSCTLSKDNPKYESIKQASVWMLRQRQLIQVGAVKYDESPMVGYAKKHWETHAPTDYTDYIAKTSGMSYEDAQLVLDTIAYYTFVDQYDSTERIAMDEHPTDPETGEQVVAKIHAADQRLSNGEKHEPIILIDQQIAYADVRNRSYTV